MKKILTVLAALLLTVEAVACTSAIFSGKITKDGRPLMWKNRDTGELNNRLENFKGPKYSYTALVNSPDPNGEAWSGSNEVGFCIMNTASYNLAVEKLKIMDGEGALMAEALGICRNLKDFENYLDTLSRPMPIEANFGVIDAEGGAAYYEVNSRTWKKTDVNDPHIAPQGYVVYSNYSYSGRFDAGMGYVRFMNAENIINKALARHILITPQWIMNNLSRSFYHSVLGIDLRESDITSQTDGWFIDQDFIPRKSTSAIAIFQGVKNGENPENTIFWCALGYGPLAMTLPVFMKYRKIPDIMVKHTKEPSNCEICDAVLELKEDIFPVKRGNGNKYFNFGKLYKDDGRGYTQRITDMENITFRNSDNLIEKLREGKLTEKDVNDFNTLSCKEVMKLYKNLLQDPER